MITTSIPPVRPEIQYPLAYKSKQSPLVVLFTKLQEGIVIVEGEGYPISRFSSTWSEHNRKDIWESINVTINH